MVSSGTSTYDTFDSGAGTNVLGGNNLTLSLGGEGSILNYTDDFSTDKYHDDAYNPVSSYVGYDNVRDAIFSFNNLGQSLGNITYKFDSVTEFYDMDILFATNGSESPGANTSVWYSYDDSSYIYANSTTSNNAFVLATIPVDGEEIVYVQFRTNTQGLSVETPITAIQINYSNYDYYSSGNYISEAIYSPNITYTTLQWNHTKPSGTNVIVQLRESDDNVTWNAWGENYTDNLDNSITDFSEDYIQYRVWLSTSNQSVTPLFESIELGFFNASTDANGAYDYNVTIPTDSLGVLPLEVRVEENLVYNVTESNFTNITIWVVTDVPYLRLENYSGANSNYTYKVNFTRTDLSENNLINGTINITLSNASGIQASHSCAPSTNCTKSWYVPANLRYGNYTLNLTGHNISNYYRTINSILYSYLENQNTTGSFYVENVSIGDYAKGSQYHAYVNSTLTNLGGGSILTPYVYLYDSDVGIEDATEYVASGRIYPDSSGNATLEIVLGDNLNPASYNLIWRVNWTNNDGTLGPNNITNDYLQYNQMYVIIPPNVTLELSNSSVYKRIEHGNNDSFTFQVQAIGSTALNEVLATFVEGNLTQNSSNISSSWVSVTSANPIPIIYAGFEENMTVQISVPRHTSPGNYTGILNITSAEGKTHLLNLTLEVPLNATWFLIPNGNFTFNNSFSLDTAGYVANYTINNTGNINITFNVDYSPSGEPDYTAYNLIVEDRGFEGGIVNPTSVDVEKNSTSTFHVFQEGRGQTTLNLNIVTVISNSSGTPVSRAIEDFWDIEEQKPGITGIWFILNGVAGNFAEQNKNVTIKVRATDDVALNTSATRANISWSGGSTSVLLSGLTSDPTQYTLDGGSYVILNYSGNYTPSFTTVYRVNATVYDLAGKSITSGMYNFSSYGTTNLGLFQNISSATVSNADRDNKGMVYVNYTVNNTGFVTGYYPKLNFSTGSDYIKVNNYTFSNISSNSTASYVVQMNVTEMTPPALYTITANLTWTQPNGNTGTDSKVFSLTVGTNSSLSVLPETLSLTTDAGEGNYSLVTIYNTGNVPLNSVIIQCISIDCDYFDIDYNDSYMTLPLNSSKVVNISFDTAQGIEGKTYLLDFNVSNGAVSDLVQSQIQVLETKTWNIEPTSIESVRNAGTSGLLDEITVSNIGNVNMTYSLYSANTSLFTINESALSIPLGFSKSFSINYSAPELAGNYSGIIVITNDDLSASPAQINITILLNSTDLILNILSPTQEVPFEELSPGDNITIEANLSYEGQVLENETSWNVKFDDTECSSVEYSYNSSAEIWEIICTVPENSGGFFHDLYVEANNQLYGIVWVIEENAVSYMDISPPQFSIVQNNIELNDDINLQVNITDDALMNDTTVFASITYPNSTIIELPLSKLGDYYRNFSVSLNVSGEYIVNYSAEDITGNFNYSIGWFEVYDNYTWSSVLQDNEGTKISGINISFYRPSTDTVLISNSTNANGNASFLVNKRYYDIFVNFSKEQAKVLNKSFSNSTYIRGNVSLGMYTLNASDFSGTIPLYNPFKGIISNSTGFSSDSVTMMFNYEGYDYDVPTALGIVKCDSWNLTSNTCGSSWTALSSSRDTTTKIVSGNSTGLAAYFLAESKCGNGLCETNYVETTTTCSADCQTSSNGTTTTTTTTSGGGGGGGGGGLSTNDLTKIEEIIRSYLNIGGVKMETTSIYKELFSGDTTTFRVSLVNSLNRENSVDVKATGDISKFLFFESTHITLAAAEKSTLLVKVVVPKFTVPGNYDGDLVLSAGGSEGEIPVTIRILSPEGNLLDVKIQPLTNSIPPGKTLRLQTDLINLGKTDKVDVQFDLQLIDINTGEIIVRTEESFAVENTISTIKELKIPEGIKTGKYMIKGTAYYSNVELDGEMQASSLAYVNVEYSLLQRNLFGIKMWVYLLFLLGIVLLVSAYFFIQYLEMKKRRFRVKVEVAKLPKPGADSAFLGKVAETDIRAFVDLEKLKTHTLIAGSTGSGKTVAAQGIIEEALLHNKSVIVFDPTAQWSGFLRECDDKTMLKRYSYFDMNTKSIRAFNGTIKTIKDPYEKIDIIKHINQPGEITIFNISQLTPKQMELVVASTIEQIFKSTPEESRELKAVIVYDEVHRLLTKFGGSGEGFIQIERGAREFRKWGIGLCLISQVLSDFVGEIKANIGTEIQLGTRYEGDLERISLKYGEDMLKSVVKAPIGTGMFVNPEYNNGRPYFISFRPLLHSTRRLSNKELEIYGKYFDLIEDIEYQINQFRELKLDILDLELELKLIKKKVKSGQFTMADMYLESLTPMLLEQWKKLGKKPQHLQKEKMEKEEIMKGVETARKDREKYIKSKQSNEIDLREELINLYKKINDSKKRGIDTFEMDGKIKSFQDKAASFKGTLTPEEAKDLLKDLNILKKGVEDLGK
jgi:hypothetical protein